MSRAVVCMVVCYAASPAIKRKTHGCSTVAPAIPLSASKFAGCPVAEHKAAAVKKPMPMKPRELWAVVDKAGNMLLEETWLTSEHAEQAIKSCRLKRCRIASVEIREVPRG